MFGIKGVIESRTCLLPMVTEQSWYMLELFEHYQAKHLYTDGGLRNQPNYYLKAMHVLRSCG